MVLAFQSIPILLVDEKGAGEEDLSTNYRVNENDFSRKNDKLYSVLQDL